LGLFEPPRLRQDDPPSPAIAAASEPQHSPSPAAQVAEDDGDTAALADQLNALRPPPDATSRASSALDGTGGGDRIAAGQSGPVPRPLTSSQMSALRSKYDLIDGIWRPGTKPLAQHLRATNSGTEIRDVPGDGNCQPAAIIATGQTQYSTLQELKAAALHSLDNHPDQVRACLQANNVIDAVRDWAAHLRAHLTTHGNEGDEISLALYAMTIQRDIETLNSQDTTRLRLSRAAPIIDLADAPEAPLQLALRPAGLPIYDHTFRLIGICGGHYSAIGPLRPPGNGQGSGPGRPK